MNSISSRYCAAVSSSKGHSLVPGTALKVFLQAVIKPGLTVLRGLASLSLSVRKPHSSTLGGRGKQAVRKMLRGQYTTNFVSQVRTAGR